MLKKYNLFNNIFGWLSFLIAATVYLLTIEPTASFWDCGEFISSAYKFEVGHPPGAPFFMLTGKFFTLFASDPSHVAMMVNAMSGLLSAATILFLFWTITFFAKKLIYTDTNKDMTLGEMITIIGCGLVGSLTYTFTDTFWFSAVEGEVYAYSSMLTALVFWLILKWDNRADQAGSDKWLVLIAFVMGLSIGVHLLNLLCIPAIVMVYYFRKTKNPNWQGTLISLAGSFALIVFLMYGIIPGVTKVGGWFELLFVNSFHLSYNAGVIVYMVLLIGVILWGLYETLSEKGSLTRSKVALVLAISLSGIVFISDNALLWFLIFIMITALVFFFKDVTARVVNTTLLCLFVVLVGYSSFALIPIRSAANPPMDQNSPENVFTLAGYLNREQYGDRPLFYGKTYASVEERDDNGDLITSGTSYSWDETPKVSPEQKDEYVVASEKPVYGYTNSMILPRMYSTEDRHLEGYKYWGDVTDVKTPPTYFQNLKFFLTYQLDFMYFRYLMWNFSGRQNDIQGYGGVANGNWITGFKWFDEHILNRGPQDNLPPSILENKGHNVYYGLPFILAILGVFYQLKKKKEGERQFFVTFLLFFMTGIAIILYLNQQPQEPRERDYAYAGSFYAFCIWIGLGVAFLWDLLKKVMNENIAAPIASIVCLFIPIQMASQNWDDHDRSDRYTMRDFGQNYLVGLPQDAIIFTMGDNDTFPLWYSQEVEGFRTDVRVCNLMYLYTDWYIDQMRRDAYESTALPITWPKDRYFGSKGAYAISISPEYVDKYAHANFEYDRKQSSMPLMLKYNANDYYDTTAFVDTMSLVSAMEILKTKDSYIPRTTLNIQEGVLLPSNKFGADINVANIDWERFGTIPQEKFVIDMKGKNTIQRSDIMVLEMLKNINEGDWKRPIYYAMTIGEPPIGLSDHSIMEGIDFRIVPGTVTPDKNINLDVTFDNVMNKYKWGNVSNPKVYMDENNLRLARGFRVVFNELINGLMLEGDSVRALQALDKSMEVLPGSTLPRGTESLSYISNYYLLGQKEKAEQVATELLHQIDGQLQWYASMKPEQMFSVASDIREKLLAEFMIISILQDNNSELYDTYNNRANSYMMKFLDASIPFDNRRHPLIMSMHIAENEMQKKLELVGDSVTIVDIADLAVQKNPAFITLANLYGSITTIDPKASDLFQFPEVQVLQLLSIDDNMLSDKQKADKQKVIESIAKLKENNNSN